MSTENVEALIGDSLPPLTPDEIMGEATIKKAAALAASGASKYKVQRTLGISQYFVNKIWRDELFRKIVAEIGDDAVAVSKSQLKSDLAKLSKLAIKAIEANLKKNNLQSAIVVLRSMGVETATKDDGKDGGGLTLILAGQKPEAAKADVVVVDRREGDE